MSRAMAGIAPTRVFYVLQRKNGKVYLGDMMTGNYEKVEKTLYTYCRLWATRLGESVRVVFYSSKRDPIEEQDRWRLFRVRGGRGYWYEPVTAMMEEYDQRFTMSREIQTSSMSEIAPMLSNSNWNITLATLGAS